MRRRSGTSLIEVLVTIGILGIGLISVIALFPMAAITMGQALKDDRTATCAATADGFIRNVHFRNVVEQSSSPTEPYYYAMDGAWMNPSNNSLSALNSVSGLTNSVSMSVPTQLATSDTNPSYPVFVDPMGVVAAAVPWSGSPPPLLPPLGVAVGDAGTPVGGMFAIPRVTLSAMYNSQAQANQPNILALRLCSQMDGLTYNDDGIAQSGTSMRELRYNWLWVLQRPTNSDRITTTCTVVVFDRRVYQYKPPGSEAVFSTTFIPGQTSVTISSAADVRKGSWVMDGTIGMDSSNVPIRQANFYRVVSVSDNGAGSYTLELNTPLTRVDGTMTQYTGNLVVMPAVADVFQRPVLSSTVGP